MLLLIRDHRQEVEAATAPRWIFMSLWAFSINPFRPSHLNFWRMLKQEIGRSEQTLNTTADLYLSRGNVSDP